MKYVIQRKLHPKRVLIAIPTANDIYPETYKSIYDLYIPDGVETTFQYFYGYRVDQIRNLIADWTVKGFDYLFAVDHDIGFAPDTLAKLLSYDKPVVGGLYIQRIPGTHNVEAYWGTEDGNYWNIPMNSFNEEELTEVDAIGFGCVLIKKQVMVDIGYPQFEYKPAIEHGNSCSEDIDFCIKAKKKGHTIWADKSIICDHYGKINYRASPEFGALDPGHQ